MGKFPGVGTHKLSKCPGVWTKKEGKCPALKNQDILNDDESHFKLAKFVLKIASFEFADLLYFNSSFMNLKIARLVLNAKCEEVVFTQSSRQ